MGNVCEGWDTAPQFRNFSEREEESASCSDYEDVRKAASMLAIWKLGSVWVLGYLSIVTRFWF